MKLDRGERSRHIGYDIGRDLSVIHAENQA